MSANLYHRQINPHHVRQGYPSIAAFKLRSVDNGELSVYDGTVISPKDAFLHFKQQKFKTIGVMSVSDEEITNVACSIKPTPSRNNPFHISICFPHDIEQELTSRRLHEYAMQRSWTYKP